MNTDFGPCIRDNDTNKVYCWNNKTGEFEELAEKPVEPSRIPSHILKLLVRAIANWKEE